MFLPSNNKSSNSLLDDYNLSNIKYLTPDEEYKLAVTYYETKDVMAAQTLAISYIPFVIKIAIKYNRYFELQIHDLVQEGIIGLFKAIKAFNPYKGYRLAAFSYQWIKHEIKEFVISQKSLVKIGTTNNQKKLFFKIGNIGRYSNVSKDQQMSDMADELNVTQGEISDLITRKQGDISLNTSCTKFFDTNEENSENNENLDKVLTMSDNQETQLIDQFEYNYKQQIVSEALSQLSDKEQFIIEKRYMDDIKWTCQELGDYFKVSKQRINELEKRALGKLKDYLLKFKECEVK